MEGSEYWTLKDDLWLAAGYLEGALSGPEIFALHSMFNSLYSNSSSLNLQVTQWFDDHIQWIQAMLTKYQPLFSSASSDPLVSFWEEVSLIMAQLRGMVDGYNHYAPPGQV